MKCPYCGQEMIHGNITGGKVLRLLPDPETPKNTHRHNRNLPPSQYDQSMEGTMLDIPYAGLAPWIPADYCRDCKKMIFETEIF